jgi:transcriptional regulator with XRE-family HTH domain
MDKKKYRPRIRLLREHIGYSQQGLAKKIGVSQSLLSRWERGESYPPFPKLKLLSSLLQCSIDDLYDI